MNYPFPGRAASPLTASMPPPALTFVSRFLLVGIAIVAAFALIASASPSVLFPLGLVFGTYLAATLAFAALGRRRGRRRTRTQSADRTLLGVGGLTVVSIVLLGAAFLAPERFGIGLAAVGFAGLLTARILASTAGWAPRYTFPEEGRDPEGRDTE